MRHDLEDWLPGTGESLSSSYAVDQILNYSPLNASLMEIRSQKDNLWLDVVYSNANCLLDDTGESGWEPKYSREFDLTNDSAYFPRRSRWEADGI